MDVMVKGFFRRGGGRDRRLRGERLQPKQQTGREKDGG